MHSLANIESTLQCIKKKKKNSLIFCLLAWHRTKIGAPRKITCDTCIFDGIDGFVSSSSIRFLALTLAPFLNLHFSFVLFVLCRGLWDFAPFRTIFNEKIHGIFMHSDFKYNSDIPLPSLSIVIFHYFPPISFLLHNKETWCNSSMVQIERIDFYGFISVFVSSFFYDDFAHWISHLPKWRYRFDFITFQSTIPFRLVDHRRTMHLAQSANAMSADWVHFSVIASSFSFGCVGISIAALFESIANSFILLLRSLSLLV